MKITIETDFTICTVETKNQGENLDVLIEAMKQCLLGLGYQPDSVNAVFVSDE